MELFTFVMTIICAVFALVGIPYMGKRAGGPEFLVFGIIMGVLTFLLAIHYGLYYYIGAVYGCAQ